MRIFEHEGLIVAMPSDPPVCDDYPDAQEYDDAYVEWWEGLHILPVRSPRTSTP